MQRYSTCCIILWKNNVFPRRRLRTLACIDFGMLLAPFGRVWASKLKPCWDLPCLLPFKLKVPVEDLQGLDFTNGDHQQKLLTQIESIKAKELKKDKPLCIIINPNSGKKINLKPIILERLEKEGFPFELMST